MTAISPDLDAPVRPKRGLGEAWAAFRRLRDTGDTKHVFEILRALGNDKPPAGYARLLKSGKGGRLAYERIELSETFGDDAWLDAFAPGTVGAAYREFIRRNNISAAGLAEAGRRAQLTEPQYKHPHTWYGRRNRDIHDVWHVLSGYNTDGLGEGCVVAFSYPQTGAKGFIIIALGVGRLGKKMRPDQPFWSALWEAYQAGKKAAWLPGEDYVALFSENLEEARKRLNISKPVVYPKILKAIAADPKVAMAQPGMAQAAG